MSDHNLLDEELAQEQQDLEKEVKVLIELDAKEVAYYPAGYKVLTSHAYLMGLLTPRIEAIRQRRVELAADDETLEEEVRVDDYEETITVALEKIEDREAHDDGDEDVSVDNDDPHPSHPSTQSPLIRPPHHLYNLTNTATISPPDIHAPIPFPPSPNILAHHHLHSYRSHHTHNQHPPDIVAPPPLPLKPNLPRRLLFRFSRPNIAWRRVDVC
jgi:hypothetical protein